MVMGVPTIHGHSSTIITVKKISKKTKPALRKFRVERAKWFLIVGTLIGFVFVLYLQSGSPPVRKAAISAPLQRNETFKFEAIAVDENNAKILPPEPNLEDADTEFIQHREKRSSGHFEQKIFDEVQNIRVLCLVTMIRPSYYKERTLHIERTWGQRCNKLLLMSSENDTNPATISLQHVKNGNKWEWAKTKEGFRYVWEHHRDDADWFINVEEDTYVIVENLRLMLHGYDTNQPNYFGFIRKEKVEDKEITYAGSEYVLSREGLRRFVEEALPDKDKCNSEHKGKANIEMGRCLSNVGVLPMDSRDKNERHRFVPLHPVKFLEPNGLQEDHWLWKTSYYPFKNGDECCSDTAISFHEVDPNDINVLEYLIYRLYPYGVLFGKNEYENKNSSILK